MSMSFSRSREFVRQIYPILEQHDSDELATYLNAHFTQRELRAFLSSDNEDAIKVALMCLSLVGEEEDETAIARLLHDDDGMVAELAEHALWSLWFRRGTEDARRDLQRAVQLIGQDQLNDAISLLDDLTARFPDLAEPYNQLGIACYLKNDYLGAVAACLQAIRLNENHFGALASLGHSYTSLDRFGDALEAYRRALSVHPRMEGLRESIHQIREILKREASLGQSGPSQTTAAESI